MGSVPPNMHICSPSQHLLCLTTITMGHKEFWIRRQFLDSWRSWIPLKTEGLWLSFIRQYILTIYFPKFRLVTARALGASPTGSPGTVTRPRSETPGGTGSLPGTTAGEFYCRQYCRQYCRSDRRNTKRLNYVRHSILRQGKGLRNSRRQRESRASIFWGSDIKPHWSQ